MSKKRSEAIDLGFLRGEGAHTDLSGMFAASVAANPEALQPVTIRIERLLNNRYQPRLNIPEAGVEELAQVIKTQGFQGVLVARPDPVNRGFYQLTAGHRRREAAKRAGLQSLPVVVRDLTDEEMVTLAITENIQREDLTPLEEGKIYLLMSEEMGFTQEQIAREVGKQRGYIVNRLRVARAPLDIQAMVQAKPDSLRAVANLIKVKDEKERADIIRQILSGVLTTEDLPGYIESRAIQEVKEVLTDVKESLREFRGERKAEAQGHGRGQGYAPGQNGAETDREQPRAAASTTPTHGDEEGGEAADRQTEGEVRPGAATSSQEQGRSTTPLHRLEPVTSGGAVSRADDEPSPVNVQAAMLDIERSAARVGDARLATAYRNIVSYRDLALGRESITPGERAKLANIKAIVDRLYERFGDQNDTGAILP